MYLVLNFKKQHLKIKVECSNKVKGICKQQAPIHILKDIQAQTQSTQAESSTQAQTQKQTTTGNVSGVYFLRNVMKEHYILPEIVKRPKEEYIQTGVLYVILALLFVNEYEMNSCKYRPMYFMIMMYLCYKLNYMNTWID